MGRPESGRRGAPLSTPRIVSCGSGAVAVPPLERLHAAGYPSLAVVSQPPKPAGRGMRLQPTPVHRLAESLGLPVLTPARARDPEFLAQLRALAPDLIMLASYGKILPQAALEIAPLGNWNLHGSLLPKYRGASPIQYALLNGERETGVTLMEMVAEMDAGDIYLQAVEPIHPDDDYGTLEARLAQRAASLLLEGLERLQAGTLTRTPQDHAAATYAPMITKDDTRIRWEEPAEQCRNRIRAFSPKPGAFTHWRGKTLKLWRAEVALRTEDAVPGTIIACAPDDFRVACGEGALRLLEVQPESRPRMEIRAFLNGYRPQVGERLG
jgi:methionyl-tRNA formyltransferase